MYLCKCPYCFDEFTTSETSDGVEFACDECGNEFTLGEARQGHPNPKVAPEVVALTQRVKTLEAQLAETTATVDMLMATVERMLSAFTVAA